FYKGKIVLIGMPNFVPMRVNFFRLKRPIERIALLSFTKLPEPDHPSLRHGKNTDDITHPPSA
ncbi:MAG: hypothetical protein ACOYNN_18785, partial [Terrimicrobiaceae bacterium]